MVAAFTKAQRMNDAPERLLVSHYENNYVMTIPG